MVVKTNEEPLKVLIPEEPPIARSVDVAITDLGMKEPLAGNEVTIKTELLGDVKEHE